MRMMNRSSEYKMSKFYTPQHSDDESDSEDWEDENDTELMNQDSEVGNAQMADQSS